jgi:hypothetical protein
MQQHVTVTRSTCNSAYRLTTFPMFSNCNATHRTRTPGCFSNVRTARATGSAPWQTTANSARPSSTRGAYLARFTQCSHSHAALPLSTIQASKSSVSERTARRPGETRPRRQRYVSVMVNLPHHNRAVAPKLPSAGSGPSGPLNSMENKWREICQARYARLARRLQLEVRRQRSSCDSLELLRVAPHHARLLAPSGTAAFVGRPARRFPTQGTCQCGLLIGLRPRAGKIFGPNANDPRRKRLSDRQPRGLTALAGGWTLARATREGGRPATRFLQSSAAAPLTKRPPAAPTPPESAASSTFLSMRVCCRSAASHARLLARSGAASGRTARGRI